MIDRIITVETRFRKTNMARHGLNLSLIASILIGSVLERHPVLALPPSMSGRPAILNAATQSQGAGALNVYGVGEANPGPASSDARLPIPFHGALYFLANDSAHGRELFLYDGVAVRLAGDINPGPANGYPSELFVFKDELLMRADDGVHGKELFAFDGESMRSLGDLWTGFGYDPYSKRVELQNGNPSQMLAAGDVMYFTARTRNDKPFGNVGLELFAYDGKQVRLATDFMPGPADGAPTCFIPFKNGYLFTCRRPETGQEVFWIGKLDDIGSLKLVADVIPGERGSRPGWFVAFKEEVIFLADSPEHGREMHRTRGEGAEIVADIHPGKKDSLASDFFVFGDELIFRADDGKHGAEVFAYDGAGVRLLADIYPGEKGSWPSRFFAHDGTLYFGADGGPECGRELYCYDGNRVQLALDINPGSGSSTPSDFAIYDDEVYLVADDGAHGRELMKFVRPIYWVQGKGHKSTIAGRRITTHGIVTAVSFNGFWIQDPVGDGDSATSDAMFVQTSFPPAVSVGDHVRVAGEVREIAAREVELTSTSLVNPRSEILSTNNPLPKAAVIGTGGRVPPSEVVDDDDMQRFDPDRDGIDFWESLEAMRVILNEPQAVAGSNRHGDNYVVVDRGATATNMSVAGNLNIVSGDMQPELIPIHVNKHVLRHFQSPRLNTGDQLTNLTGIVDYEFGRYQVVPTEVFDCSARYVVEAPVSKLTSSKDAMTVGSYNVFVLDPIHEKRDNVPKGLAYDDVDDDVGSGRYLALARQVVRHLNVPDIVGIQELQDGDGAELSKDARATKTLLELVRSIESVGGPRYEIITSDGLIPAYRDERTGELISPSGNMPGNNLQVGMLYNPKRVKLVADSVRLLSEPASHARDSKGPFFQTPIPLAATFEFCGRNVCVIVNHWTAKTGSTGRYGALQPWLAMQNDPQCNGNVDRRCAQANAVADWIDLQGSKNLSFVVIGDFNETGDNSPLAILQQRGLRNLSMLMPTTERATTWFDGLGEQIDHILVSGDLSAGAEIDIVSINGNVWQHPSTAGEFDVQGASDHDPILAKLRFSESDLKATPSPDTSIHAVSNRPN